MDTPRREKKEEDARQLAVQQVIGNKLPYTPRTLLFRSLSATRRLYFYYCCSARVCYWTEHPPLLLGHWLSLRQFTLPPLSSVPVFFFASSAAPGESSLFLAPACSINFAPFTSWTTRSPTRTATVLAKSAMFDVPRSGERPVATTIYYVVFVLSRYSRERVFIE